MIISQEIKMFYISIQKITARMNEFSVQKTVDHIFEVCGAGLHGNIGLSDWLEHHESDPRMYFLFNFFF